MKLNYKNISKHIKGFIEAEEISPYWEEYAINWDKIEKLYLNAVSDGYFKKYEYNEFADYLKELQDLAHNNEIRSVCTR